MGSRSKSSNQSSSTTNNTSVTQAVDGDNNGLILAGDGNNIAMTDLGAIEASYEFANAVQEDQAILAKTAINTIANNQTDNLKVVGNLTERMLDFADKQASSETAVSEQQAQKNVLLLVGLGGGVLALFAYFSGRK